MASSSSIMPARAFAAALNSAARLAQLDLGNVQLRIHRRRVATILEAVAHHPFVLIHQAVTQRLRLVIVLQPALQRCKRLVNGAAAACSSTRRRNNCNKNPRARRRVRNISVNHNPSVSRYLVRAVSPNHDMLRKPRTKIEHPRCCHV